MTVDKANEADMLDGHKTHTIFVNAREQVVESDELSYEEVLRLAFGDQIPSGPTTEIIISYRNSGGRPADGLLVAGRNVKVHDGTAFVASAADKS